MGDAISICIDKDKSGVLAWSTLRRWCFDPPERG